MNLFDFDKTIYRKDSSIEFFKFCFLKCFGLLFFVKVVFAFFLNKIGVLKTKRFKEIFFSFLTKTKDIDTLVENFWDKEIKNINAWYLEMASADDVVCSASPKFLIDGAFKKLRLQATVFGTDMDKNTGLISGENLKGVDKAKFLKSNGYFAFENVYTDSLSDFPILDMTEKKWIVCGKNVYRFGSQKPTFGVKLKYLFKQLRVKHYVKNGIILLPLMFGDVLTDLRLCFLAIMGTIAFCLTSSVVYIINDLVDANKDRKHSKKRKRPVASFMVTPTESVLTAVVLVALIALIVWLCFGFNIWLIALLLVYLALNFAYSFYLKTIPVVDVFALAACYLIRLFYGGVLIDVGVSKWLYLTVLCASLYMGFGKRRNEISKEGSETRKVSKLYSYNFLDKNLYLCLAMCLIFYSLWVINVRIVGLERLNAIMLQATIPLVFFILMKYSFDIEKSASSGDPIEVLFKDKLLIFICLIFVAVVLVSIYVPIPWLKW